MCEESLAFVNFMMYILNNRGVQSWGPPLNEVQVFTCHFEIRERLCEEFEY